MRKSGATIARVETRELNGLPALVIDFEPRHARRAPRVVIRCDLGASGRIVRCHSILASAKLASLRPAAIR